MTVTAEIGGAQLKGFDRNDGRWSLGSLSTHLETNVFDFFFPLRRTETGRSDGAEDAPAGNLCRSGGDAQAALRLPERPGRSPGGPEPRDALGRPLTSQAGEPGPPGSSAARRDSRSGRRLAGPAPPEPSRSCVHISLTEMTATH